ncbi:uncharacterized protein RHOBADRAFT_52563 [Rhodotorula graminis WP1]|uniref:RRM domain-containing protein n=1 Tax=Rhodotorula graminis (strain WP1) TaxID=578459 RepID=A0A194S771_RHOGW|nr:uncharacterized protein RHOBADRAFT_52563 [Rhodotorula graminis WP1]KPV76573.1 hypothetical protein RHOBADRAFT_52563 [Rhodotorula graminis WP1]
MASLLERTLGGIRKDNAPADSRRTSGGGGQSRNSPYARPVGDSWKHDKFDTPDSSSSTLDPASRPTGASSSTDQGPSNKLVIHNLHYEVSERELELLFVQIGPMATAPKIKFDRSGRSTGTAWVTYLEDKHAAKAKEAFNGAMAKGEPIEVDFDYRNDRPSERGAAAPGSLLARLGGTESGSRGPKYAAPTRGPGGGGPDRAPRAERGSAGAPRDGPRGGERGERERGGRGGVRGGRGGRGGERSAGGGRGEKRAPKTNEDLDAELEAFMKAPAAEDKPKPAAAPAPAAGGDDVDMS